MAERLEKLAQQADPMNNPFLSIERVKLLQPAVAATTDTHKQQELTYFLACTLLNAGQNADALRRFEELQQTANALDPETFLRNRTNLKISEALCWMRIGELTNCLADHNPDSCLAPIQGRDVHRFQDGSRHAMQILTELLKQEPENLKARWLLNIASMTVGDYPERVPAQWLIPPGAFASEYDIKRFPDPDAHVNLGVALYKRGDSDQAISQFQQALKLQPDHAQARKNLNALLDRKSSSVKP